MSDDFIANENFDFEKAYNESFKDVQENTVITATVIDISGDTVFLDFGYKSEAKVLTSDFEVRPKIGDEIELYLIRLEGRAGEPIVSKQKADYFNDRNELVRVWKEREVISGKVIEINKGGCIVKHKNITGFIPHSLFDVDRQVKLEEYKNKNINFYVDKIEFNQNPFEKKGYKKEEEFIGNRKKFIMQENNTLRKEFFEEKKDGDIITGIIKKIIDFGVFIDIGGFDAFLPINEVAWRRKVNIKDVLKENEEIRVKILNVDKKKGKVVVGLKQLQDDPWDKFIEKYKNDDVVVGTVMSIAVYGVFVDIFEGIEGLLHISDMSWIKRIKNPSELVKIGQKLELKIIKINKDSRRVSLSLKHLLDNPWDKVEEKYKPGTKIKAKIKTITTFGVFIELEEGVDALLHVEDVSWTENIRNPHDRFNVGDEIEGVIIQCDSKKAKIRIGIKQMLQDPWDVLKKNYKSGDIITGIVENIDEEKGLSIKITDEISCFVPLLHAGYGKKEEVKSSLKTDYKVGEEIKAIITNLDIRKRRINVSIKEYLKKQEKEKVQAFLHDSNEDSKYKLGDMINFKKND